MTQTQGRRLRDGRTVAVHRNAGLRKICACPRRVWAKCPHPWHLNFHWRGKDYRFSLDRYAPRHVESKTEAEALAERIRTEIRDGCFGKARPSPVSSNQRGITFEMFGEIFVESYSKAREKASWEDDSWMVRTIMSFPLAPSGSGRLGEKPLRDVVEADLETFIWHLGRSGRSVATRNHFVGILKTMSGWAVRKGYRSAPFVTGDSDVIRRKKARKRNRRLEPGEEDRLLRASGPHLQRVIIAALETCCRLGELLQLQWRDLSLGRGEIHLRAEKTKTRTDRIIPISTRLRSVLEMVRNDAAGEPFGPTAHVFGDDTGRRVKSVRRAWQTAVLKAHDHTPIWIWAKGKSRKGAGKLSPQSRVVYRQIDLHFHDLRHEAGSRLLEAGWPLHEVQQMLGHASLEQTSTYLNATLRGLHRSMRAFDQARAKTALREQVNPPLTGNSCNLVASTPSCDPLAPCKATAPAADKLFVN
jgi:integrase